MPEQRDFRHEVTDKIIQMLEQGTAPWQKPWHAEKAGQLQPPFNPTTGRPYRGGNAIHLMMTAAEKGYGDSRWVTARQAPAPMSRATIRCRSCRPAATRLRPRSQVFEILVMTGSRASDAAAKSRNGGRSPTSSSRSGGKYAVWVEGLDHGFGHGRKVGMTRSSIRGSRPSRSGNGRKGRLNSRVA